MARRDPAATAVPPPQRAHGLRKQLPRLQVKVQQLVGTDAVQDPVEGAAVGLEKEELGPEPLGFQPVVVMVVVLVFVLSENPDVNNPEFPDPALCPLPHACICICACVCVCVYCRDGLDQVSMRQCAIIGRRRQSCGIWVGGTNLEARDRVSYLPCSNIRRYNHPRQAAQRYRGA